MAAGIRLGSANGKDAMDVTRIASRSIAITAVAAFAISSAVVQSSAVGINAALRNKVEIRSAADIAMTR